MTQNIDDLHERAGSRNLIHMHGELLKARCTACAAVHRWREDLAGAHRCPGCARSGCLRPHVVWFGEMPLELDAIHAALERCALFVAIGTSGQVYPAAGFVEAVRRAGRAHTIELNLEPSAVSSMFAEHRQGPAATLVPAPVEELMARGEQGRSPSGTPASGGGFRSPSAPPVKDLRPAQRRAVARPRPAVGSVQRLAMACAWQNLPSQACKNYGRVASG